MTTNKNKKQLGLIIGISTIALAAVQAKTVTAQVLSCPQPLIYGNYTVTCPTASTAKIAPSGTRSVTGCLTTGGAPFNKAICNVSQSFPFKTIQISVPSNSKITRTAGAETMPLTSFNLVTDANGPTYTTSLPFITVPIGATLQVGSNPVGGDYQGTFTVNAVFQ